MSEVHVNFIAFGRVENNHCVTAERKINDLLGDQIQTLCLTPYTLITQPRPIERPDGQIAVAPAQAIPGFVVITEHVENKEEKQCPPD